MVRVQQRVLTSDPRETRSPSEPPSLAVRWQVQLQAVHPRLPRGSDPRQPGLLGVLSPRASVLGERAVGGGIVGNLLDSTPPPPCAPLAVRRRPLLPLHVERDVRLDASDGNMSRGPAAALRRVLLPVSLRVAVLWAGLRCALPGGHADGRALHPRRLLPSACALHLRRWAVLRTPLQRAVLARVLSTPGRGRRLCESLAARVSARLVDLVDLALQHPEPHGDAHARGLAVAAQVDRPAVVCDRVTDSRGVPLSHREYDAVLRCPRLPARLRRRRVTFVLPRRLQARVGGLVHALVDLWRARHRLHCSSRDGNRGASAPGCPGHHARLSLRDADQERRLRADGVADAVRRRFALGDALVTPYTEQQSDAVRHANPDALGWGFAVGHAVTQPNPYGDADAVAFAHANSFDWSLADGYTHPEPLRHALADAGAHADADPLNWGLAVAFVFSGADAYAEPGPVSVT